MTSREPTQRRDGTLAWIVVGMGVIVLLLVILAIAGLGLFVATGSEAESGPVMTAGTVPASEVPQG